MVCAHAIKMNLGAQSCGLIDELKLVIWTLQGIHFLLQIVYLCLVLIDFILSGFALHIQCHWFHRRLVQHLLLQLLKHLLNLVLVDRRLLLEFLNNFFFLSLVEGVLVAAWDVEPHVLANYFSYEVKIMNQVIKVLLLLRHHIDRQISLLFLLWRNNLFKSTANIALRVVILLKHNLVAMLVKLVKHLILIRILSHVITARHFQHDSLIISARFIEATWTDRIVWTVGWASEPLLLKAEENIWSIRACIMLNFIPILIVWVIIYRRPLLFFNYFKMTHIQVFDIVDINFEINRHIIILFGTIFNFLQAHIPWQLFPESFLGARSPKSRRFRGLTVLFVLVQDTLGRWGG